MRISICTVAITFLLATIVTASVAISLQYYFSKILAMALAFEWLAKLTVLIIVGI